MEEKIPEKKVKNNFLFGLLNVLIIFVVFWLTWYLFIDPTGPVKTYPNIAGAGMFWMIIVIVWFAFNGELYLFRNLKQPVKGIVLVLLTTLISIAIVWFLNVVYGSFNPAFSISRPPANFGAFVGALMVLIGFYAWPVQAVTWQHWPWSDIGVKQPFIGLIQFFVGFFIMILGYSFLVFPALATWQTADWYTQATPLFTVPSIVGRFYMVPLVHLTLANAFELWPWRLIKNRTVKAIVSFVGIMVISQIIFPLVLGLAKLLMGPTVVSFLTEQGMINLHAAELGVCILTWVVIWAILGNWPTKFKPAVNYLLRLLIGVVLGSLTYLVLNRWAAVNMLHEPAMGVPGLASYGGDPLTSVDWFLTIAFFYLVYFESWGLKRFRKN